MATEAEIIQEPVSIVKTEEESSKHLNLDLSEKAVEFLAGDSKKSEGGFTAPGETDERSIKSEKMEVASNNGVETMKTVSQGNPEISKDECFLISSEISKVSDETCGMSEHIKVDDTPFKAEKIPDDEEKMANVEVIAEGTKIDQNDDIESNKQEANLELKKQDSVDTPDPIIDSSREANEVVTESGKSNLVQEELEGKTLPAPLGKEEGNEAIDPIETSGSEKDQILSDSIGHTLTSTIAETSESKGHETASEISEVAKDELRNENPHEEIARVHEPAVEVHEKLEVVSGIIIKDPSQATIESRETDRHRDYANSGSEKVVEANDKELALTETSDDVKKDEESTVPTPEGSTRELENIDVVQQSQDGKSENKEIPKEIFPKESFEQQNELEKKKPAGPLNEVYEDVNTAVSTETSEKSTSIKESKEKDLQVEVNENPETVEVEISSKNADVSHVTDVQPAEQVHEAVGASEKKQECIEDVSETYQSRDSTKSEHVFAEAAAATTDLKSETSEMDKENIEDNLKQEETKEVFEGSKSIIKEEQATMDKSPKSTEEERNKSFQEVEKGETPEKEVYKEPETAASGSGKENPENEEHLRADISNSSVSDETVKEVIMEDESIPLNLTEEEEITPSEDKEDLVHSSSFELEEPKKDSEQKSLGERSIHTADSESASTAVSLAATGHEGIGVDSDADVDVKPAESSISREEDGMQDKIPNAENEDQMEKITREIHLKEITDENSEKDQIPYEHSETPMPKATDNQSGQDEESSDLGSEKEKIKDGKPLDAAVYSGETLLTSNGVEKAIHKEDKLAQNLAKAETDLEPMVEGQSKEPIPEPSMSQADETITVVQNQESEKLIEEEPEDKQADEDHIDSEENANEVTKGVILSEEIDKEVEKADASEDIKEHVVKEESSTNELHLESRGDETTNGAVLVEDNSSVSTECLKEGDSTEEQVEAKSSEVEEHSTKESEASLIVEESEWDHGTGAMSEETEHKKTKEEVPTKQDVVTGDGITIEQTLAANEPEEGAAASSALLSREQGEETISTINKIDEEKINEAEVSKDFSDAKQTAEISLEKVEFQEVEDDRKDETAAAQAVEGPKEQSRAPALPSENIEHETTANKEDEVEKLKEIPQMPEAVADQETTVVAHASITEVSPEIKTIGTVEKLEESERKEAEKLEDETKELHAVPEEEIISGQTSSDEQLHSLTAAVISEELEHETKKAEDEKSKEEISEDASDARKTNEISSQKGKSVELEAVAEDETTAGHTLSEKKSEQVQNPTSALLPKEEECLQVDNEEDVSLQKEQLQEDEALAKDASSQTLPTEKSDEQIPNPVVTLPSDEHKHETINEVDKNEESDGARVEEVSSEKDERRVAEAVLEGETNSSEVITEESKEYGTVREQKIIEETETIEDDKSPQLERVSELPSALKDGATAAQTVPGEKLEDQLHITTYTLPSEKHETKESEVEVKTREVEEASNVEVETLEKGFDNALLMEPEESANKDKLLKEEVLEDMEVTETSYSTSHSEEPIKDGNDEYELKDKLIEAETLKTTQNEELVVEAEKSSENEIIEKQIFCEDKTVKDPGQASGAKIETATVVEEETSLELSQADSEGTQDHVESNEINDGAQKPEETTNLASDNQISRELDPSENPEITSSIAREPVPIDLQEKVAESLQQAKEVEDVKEIYPNEAEVSHGGDKIRDISGEEITEQSTSVADSTKVSSSDHIESSTKDSLQAAEDMIKETVAKDEKGTAQILPLEELEEQTPALSSESPSEEAEHGVTSKVDAVSVKELKEVETLDKDSSDTKTESQICLENEEKKELKAVVEQETIAVQAPPTEIKEVVPHFEDGGKEDELKDERTGDKTNETLKIPTYEFQNEKISVETLKDDANNNNEKDIVAKDKTITGEADPVESRTRSSTGKEDFPTEQQYGALETTEKPEAGGLEPGKAREISPEAQVDHGEEKADISGVEIIQEPASVDSGKSASVDLGNASLSDAVERSTGEKIQVAEPVIEERELTVSKEEPQVKKAETIQAKEAKTGEGEEGDEHNKTDSGSDAPVMVEAPKDTDTKPHKKSQNILSGVGSKVKHSISKVKKAITGKSSHSKEPKPISPKGSEK